MLIVCLIVKMNDYVVGVVVVDVNDENDFDCDYDENQDDVEVEY